jgi:hypothetical protein
MKALTVRRYDVDESGCWTWAGDKNSEGYGRLVIDARTLYAHRLSYQLHVGPINRGEQVDHLCRNRACCNPDHLELVTSLENSLRGNHPLYVVARLKVCAQGHDLTADSNVYVRPDGRRRCRVCQITKQRERRANARVNS